MARVLADCPRQRFLMVMSDADEVVSPAFLRDVRARASALYYTETSPITEHHYYRGYSKLRMEVYRYGWQWKEPFSVRATSSLSRAVVIRV